MDSVGKDPVGGTVAPAASGGPLRPTHTGPHPDDPALPAPDPLHTLLSRCSYGIRPGDWDHAVAIDYPAWLQEQLDPMLDDAGVEASVAALWPRVAMSAGELLGDARANNNGQRAAADLRAATLYRQVLSPRQLFETLVEFWGDHFNIATLAQPESFFKNVDDRLVIRAHALGNFRDMLHASARSLAMLYYLDNVSNRASGPNENYARELMELHTLGVGGGYTEQDVAEVARCFTGWTVTTSGTEPVFAFLAGRHDAGAKSVLGTAIPAGGGISDGNAVLDLLAAHPSTAQHIARKLCIRFIGDAPQQTAIDAVAATYTATGGDIRAMMATLLGSQEFISSYDRKVRRPQDYLLATLRATDATLAGNWLTTLVSRLGSLGQLPFRWGTPDGYPDAMDDWVNAGAMLGRWNWSFAVAEGKAAGIALSLPTLYGSATTPATLLDRLADRLLHRTLLDADRDALVAFAANGGAADRTLPAGELPTRTRELVGLLLSSVYFQYR
jgi:uncharacterized protein (DUF1800 family)